MLLLPAACSVFSGGAAAAVAAAGQAGLIHQGTQVLPQRVHAMAQLAQDSWLGMVHGFDLSPANECRWFPGIAPTQLPRQHAPDRWDT